ncbi:putative bifunctional diguanylate cyclase/phosphodiesterase [Salinihabitans flavidus]|uniref:putative bifunctional diguanylate cyclase/phosphodiesterase n=1 Tax=Salinihabitans flavidus TaxID=569882 RepID=UPI001FE160F2|nr:bifunctional diguanylate cyclase/phosphodiesterase [Salinihabitans flavidus]
MLRDRVLPIVLPVIMLTAYSQGGERWLMVVAMTSPFLFLLLSGLNGRGVEQGDDDDYPVGLLLPAALPRNITRSLRRMTRDGQNTVCLFIQFDNFSHLRDRFGDEAVESLMRQAIHRVGGRLRAGDLFARTGDGQFAIFLKPVRKLDLETCIQLASRLQAAVEEPMSLDDTDDITSCSVGFCLASRAPDRTSKGLLRAAELALAEARRCGPGAIRAYSTDLCQAAAARRDLHDEALNALQNGEVRAWFQPQISTDTGRVTGFEALARWEHPERGIIPPIDFLESLHLSGQLVKLAEVMTTQALTALKAWDAAGLGVPNVGVNFAGDELRDPALTDRIRWELDRNDLAPDRLAIEVLETVISSSADDAVTHNINGLSRLGCKIDLDDFGTGHASISSIRRYAVSRLKIDRSFIMNVDQDPEQQQMIAAIVTMAEQLGLETLAEGVETRGEHTMLAQLGCAHVQGFSIARPMPFEKTIDWVTRHNAMLAETPAIRHRIS